MQVIDKPKGLDEASFIMRVENGYVLIARYQYERKGSKFLLFYTLKRDKKKYLLIIQEGIEDADFGWGFESERHAEISFISVHKAIEYLKEKENFKIEDWTFTSEGRKDRLQNIKSETK